MLAAGPPSLPAAMVAEVVHTVLEDLSQPAPSSWTELCASTLMLPLMTLPKFQAKSWPMCPVSELSTGQGHKSSSCSPVWVFTSSEPSRVRFTADQLSTPNLRQSGEVSLGNDGMGNPCAWSRQPRRQLFVYPDLNCWNCPTTKGQDTHRGPHQHSVGVTPLLWKVRVKRIPILNSLSLCGPGEAALLTSDLQSTHQNKVSISESPSPQLGWLGGGDKRLNLNLFTFLSLKVMNGFPSWSQAPPGASFVC